MLAPTPYFADRGCHVRIYEEARTLVEAGCDIRIVTYHMGRDMDGIPTARTFPLPWYRKLAPGPSWHKPFLDILLFFKAALISSDFRPHIIHAHLHEGALIGMVLKKLLKIPLIMDYQGSLTAECLDHNFFRKGGLLYSLSNFAEGVINRAADAVITSTTEGAVALSQKWGISSLKVNPVTDGVDPERFFPCSGEEIRKFYGIPLDMPVIVFLGVLNEYQGIDLLLQAALIIKKKGITTHLLIMGYPDTPYHAKASDMGLSDMITFTGRVDYEKISSFLSAGNIAVSPKLSMTEGNGKILNYMASALPTVAFDTATNREISGEAALYADYGDPDDLASKLSELLLNPELIRKLSTLARERAVNIHSWQARGGEIISVYRKLLEPDSCD